MRRGFTLPELMAVVAIVGVMAAVAMSAINGSSSGVSAGALARSLQFSMMNARSQALSDGFMRQLNCTLAASSYNGFCNVEKCTVPGNAACTTWNVEQRINFGTHATIWNLTNSTDAATSNAGGVQATGVKVITFKPDGSSDTTGKTIYVADTNGSNKSNQFKIFVYPGTGMARLVNIW